MSYALRNTIILLIVLAVLTGGSWSYIHYVQEKQIDQLSNVLDGKKQRLHNDQGIANQYDEVVDKYARVKIKLKNYHKMLPLTQDASKLYAYLNKTRTDHSQMDINFTVVGDSKVKKEGYGILKINISGKGRYRDIFDFIRTIEYSSPINKVKKLAVNPVNGKELRDVNFTFELDSYYSNSKQDNKIAAKIVHPVKKLSRNPFYPIIRSVEPNKLGLPNVENSKLVGVGQDVIYIVDQNGKVQQLHIGDKVYLGSLVKTNLNNKSATFYLNKGGIFDKVVLQVK
ncbi:MAG TPA: type 4a pilus biogenesis protein PilO [Bacteroidales bacterium]|nr:type 4a pilus biogenesis protein PilO [Bacteroidales bacterium]